VTEPAAVDAKADRDHIAVTSSGDYIALTHFKGTTLTVLEVISRPCPRLCVSVCASIFRSDRR
jgi:hypothetical protein